MSVNDDPQEENIALSTINRPDVEDLNQLYEKVQNEIKQEEDERKKLEDRLRALEQSRREISTILLGCIAATILGTFLYIYISVSDTEDADKNDENAKELITLIWTSEVGLVGGALGYYFGSRNK